MALGKSFIYIKNNRGPKDDPCDTPCVFVILVEQFPSMDTNCSLVKFDVSNLSVGPLIP